jgi:Arylsulfotransferase (ASST)/Divergent InlB B-repeat domain
MKAAAAVITMLVIAAFSHSVTATQADTTTITITGQQPGVTPFISIVSLTISDPTVLHSIQFTITPQTGSVTRPLSATYLVSYLVARGYFNLQTGQLTLPVFGLYAGDSNNVTLTYLFNDGSSTQTSVAITTPTYPDPCGFNNPIVAQPRTQATNLSYDYILIKSGCSPDSPTIIDTDGAIRWVGTAGIASKHSTFFDNAVYLAHESALSRIELDGTVLLLQSNYNTTIGVGNFHHNIDYGKFGMILDGNKSPYDESVNVEVDNRGNVLKIWDLANIISAAMQAGGDDPTQFVYPQPADWFHNNSTTYRSSDNSLIVSSRENFVICLDYDSGAIKWILGDETKKWYEFPSLRQFALTVATGGVAPIGQHAVSITNDNNLLLIDNGSPSGFQSPAGVGRNNSAPRKYALDLQANTATEVWNYTREFRTKVAACSSVYEDAPLNYLIDYVGVRRFQQTLDEIVGLNASGQIIFDYCYSTTETCNTDFNAMPVHLESLVFPTSSPSPSATPTPTPTPAPTATPTATATATPTVTPTLTPTPTPTATPTVQVTVQTTPAGVAFTVDGTSYFSTQTFSWARGSTHTIATTSPQSGGTGVQYVWTHWSDAGAISHTVAPTMNETYTAIFRTQYYLTMAHGAGGTVSPGNGWRNSGTTVSISATPTNNNQTSYSFGGWTGTGNGSYSGTNNPASITMNGPITENGSFTQNNVQVTVQTNLSGLSFTVDGTTYTATQTFSWVPGSSHTIATTSPQSGGAGVQYAWTNWSGGGTISHTVAPTTNTTYTASFTTQYYLTMAQGTGGTVTPPSGWKTSGTVVSIRATPSNGYSFTGWTGSGTGSYSGTNNPASVTMGGPITEMASFTHN